ncbi:MAG: alpha-(1-_3)-arabinofuranosyltransferase family protein, partial [Actinomycetota bacterium]
MADASWRRWRWWYVVAAFVPSLLTDPGRISADTKTYLSVDPGRLLADATSMWDPSVGAGTVPHQNIGYLFPLGPWYWSFDAVGIPDWIAQRVLWALLVLAASWGVCRLGRLLGWSPTMAGVAGFAYGFTPYVLNYLARISAILFPWAAMPWLIIIAIALVRRPRWRTAAAFAGVIALVGSVNATSLVLAGLGPVVWAVADLVTRRTTLRSTLDATARAGLLSAAVSAWWIAGLAVQGGFGLPILRFTETYRAIAGASTPTEVLRGLGYWFFYGGDRLDHWIGPSASYTNEGWLILLGFGISMAGLLGLLSSFPRRGTVVAIFVIGMVVSVGGAPIDDPTIFGGWFDAFATESTAGGALRSTTRAMPLVLLGMGAGLGALAEQARRRCVD